MSKALVRVLELALFLRVATGLAVEWYVRRGVTPRVCVFPDSEYYWALAGTIREGRSFEIVEWGDIPHSAIRTPGYPLFLAICRVVSGDRPLAARLAQAVLGTLSVWLVYRLTREVVGESVPRPGGRDGSLALAAALLAALHPYFLVMSAVLLSEAVFVPLMLAVLWGVARAWNRLAEDPASGMRAAPLLAIGAAGGAAILVRPSWILFIPVLISGFLQGMLGRAEPRRGRAVAGMRAAAVVLLGLIAVLAPWWVRNARVFGRFVPTAVWMGASLYDGLNPRANGGSDMSFLADPEFWPLDELDQDRRLRQAAVAFALGHPRRVMELAARKLGKYWCPWPSAEGLRAGALAVAAGLMEAPLLGLIGMGLWRLRREPRAWILLAGPLLYFCALHLIFASSMRYRIPGEFPAMGLAAAGMARLTAGRGAQDGCPARRG